MKNWGLSGLQQRLEASRAGRGLISLFIAATLVAVVISNLPTGRVRTRAYSIAEPYLNASGLWQSWRIFGPVPRSTIEYLEARVRRADGTVSVWRPPSNGALIGAYRDERWRKFVEHAVFGRDEWPWLWPSAARYAAREVGRRGARPVEVTLVRRAAEEIPPGKGPPYLTSFEDVPYYTLKLTSPP